MVATYYNAMEISQHQAPGETQTSRIAYRFGDPGVDISPLATLRRLTLVNRWGRWERPNMDLRTIVLGERKHFAEAASRLWSRFYQRIMPPLAWPADTVSNDTRRFATGAGPTCGS